MSEDIDEIDDEEIWTNICQMAAQRAGISIERAKTILEDAGYHAYGRAGIVEAIDIVSSGRRRDGPFRSPARQRQANWPPDGRAGEW